MKKILLILIMLSSFMFANIAKITTLKGGVEVLRDSKTLQATKDFKVLEKDTIKTSKDGRVQLLFTDNTIISIGYNSTFSIDEYVNDANQAPKAKFGLKKGFFKSITGKIGKLNPDRFKLKTKSASIGIRGTTILAKIEDNEEKIICSVGAIRVSNEHGWSDPYAGEKTYVRNGGKPTPPEPASAEEIQELEDQSGATENEEESGIDQAMSDSLNDPTKTNKIPRFVENTTNNQIQQNIYFEPETTDIMPSIYYNSTLTNYFNQSNDVYNTNQRKIVKASTGSEPSTQDGSYGDYLSWGHWGVDGVSSEAKTDYSGTTYNGRSYWMSGTLTPIKDVPQSGSATYTGTISGNIFRDASAGGLQGSTVSGTTTITSNFSSGTLSGTFEVTGFVTASLDNVTITRETYGATFSGNLTGSEVNTGDISGAFYGDNAAAIGGIWSIEKSTSDATNQDAASGTFAAQKQ